MAIQTNYQTVYGFTQQNAYVKIERFSGDKNEITFNTEVYVSSDARDNSKVPLDRRFYSIPYYDGITMVDLYNYVKTQPEYPDPIDV